MNKTGKIVAVVPVRAGSRRLRDKNILPFGNSNLLIHKIRQLKRALNIDEVLISSDSEEMLSMGENEGTLIHKRSLEYSDDITKPFGDVVAHVAENVDADYIVWAPCTCPLVHEELYNKAVNVFFDLVISQQKYDSLISVKLFKEFLWDEHAPINYQIGAGHVLSQNLPNWQIVINGFFIARRLDMIKWKYFFGTNPYRMIIDKKYAVDIDDAEDFEIAKALLAKHG